MRITLHILRPYLVIVLACGFALSVVAAETAKQPEEVVLAYFAAFNDTTFKKSTQYLHPQLLAQFKKNVRASLTQSDAEGKSQLLHECGIATMEEFENISDKEFYSRRLRSYWNIDSMEKEKRYQEMMQSISYSISETLELAPGKHQVKANSIIAIGSGYEKEHVYTLEKYDGSWKITEIEIAER